MVPFQANLPVAFFFAMRVHTTAIGRNIPKPVEERMTGGPIPGQITRRGFFFKPWLVIGILGVRQFFFLVKTHN